jgi:pyrroloquinoline-quinone synthase
VHFCRDKTPLEAIASSLTELFAPNLHEERISGMLQHYDFVNPDIMSYFSRRLTQAPRDAGFALEYVKAHAKTPAEREAVCNALIFKTNVLWVQLDALYHAYVEGHIPARRVRTQRGLAIDGFEPQHQCQRGEPAEIAAAHKVEIR